MNTIAGFSVIFLLMWFGMPALIANVLGYATGFLLGFALTKKVVFRSNGHMAAEGFRYLLAFTISFLANFAVVAAFSRLTVVNMYFAQMGGAVAYTLGMYLLSRYFVFRASMSAGSKA